MGEGRGRSRDSEGTEKTGDVEDTSELRIRGERRDRGGGKRKKLLREGYRKSGEKGREG